jgi:hypothetical protein
VLNLSKSKPAICLKALSSFRSNFDGVLNENCTEWEEIQKLLAKENINGKGHTIPQTKDSDSDREEPDFD